MTGYEAIRETVGFVPDRDRHVLAVRGSRAERVLNGLATQATEGVLAGTGRYAFFLDPKGRVVADARLLPAPDGASFWLDVPGAAREAMDAHIAKYVPPIFAEVSPARVRPMALLGPEAATALADAVREPGSEPVDLDGLAPLETRVWRLSDGGIALIVAREPIEIPGLDVFVPEPDAERVAAWLERAVLAHGGLRADREAVEAARIERGLPIYGRELGPDRLAQEAGQDERAIRFDKGCYTGQEVVARIHYRGHVNRHLRGIRFGGAPDTAPGASGETPVGWPGPGAELYREGRAVGIVTSATDSPTFGPIALAYVRREVEPGNGVATAASGPEDAVVTELPFTER